MDPDTPDAAAQPVAAHAAPLLDESPRRVVSLVPSLTESLFDLDLGARLIAVTDACVHPAGALDGLARVGAPDAPDCDQIIALAPDLVFVSDEVNPPSVADELLAAGLTVWQTGPRSVFEALNLLWDIMNAFDHPVMVPRVQAIERAYDATLAASRATPPVTVFAPLSRDPWRCPARASFTHDLLRVCGGESLFPEGEPVTPDDLVAAQPDVILLPEGEGFPFGVDDANRLAALDIPAARRGHIHLIDGTLLTWPGTRIAYALRDLPALLASAMME
jgi:ABC-type Fe3+-hydroxamate transport system substrate-binding protein